jgi:acyl-CoA synthetase (AMP-forming)/AMP-acid ligase II
VKFAKYTAIVLMDGNTAPLSPWPNSITTYRDALLHVLEADPDRIVIRDSSGPISAEGFLDRIGIMCLLLQGHTPPRMDKASPPRVGIALHDNVWSMAGVIACWLVGLTPLRLDHRQSADDMRETIRANALRLVVTRQKRLLDCAAEVILIEDPADVLADAKLVVLGRNLLANMRQTKARADDVAEFLTSSGVSGPARFYPVTQQQVLRLAIKAASEGHRGKWGTALSAVSAVFGGARLIWWRNLVYGRPIHALPLLFTISELDTALRDEQVEECTLPPHILRALVQHAAAHAGPVPRYPHLLKLQSIGGPALAVDKLAAQTLLSPHYLMTYSSTETGVVALIQGEDLRRRPESCGKPLRGVQVDIVDADEIPVPSGTIGRIRVKRLQYIDGESFLRTAWPGDLGWLDDEGYLFIAARGDGIICRNGVNYSSSVLEAKLLGCPNTADVAVLRIPREAGDDDTLIAVLPARSDNTAPIDPKRLARDLRRRLSSHEQPQAIVLLGAAHITPGGKIRRSAVLESFLSSPSTMVQI